jgi:hypothetical protein
MAAMVQVFRRAVGASPLGDPFVDDEQYQQAWATMCAYRIREDRAPADG